MKNIKDRIKNLEYEIIDLELDGFMENAKQARKEKEDLEKLLKFLEKE